MRQQISNFIYTFEWTVLNLGVFYYLLRISTDLPLSYDGFSLFTPLFIFIQAVKAYLEGKKVFKGFIIKLTLLTLFISVLIYILDHNS